MELSFGGIPTLLVAPPLFGGALAGFGGNSWFLGHRKPLPPGHLRGAEFGRGHDMLKVNQSVVERWEGLVGQLLQRCAKTSRLGKPLIANEQEVDNQAGLRLSMTSQQV